MLSCIMDYLEGWDVATVDILGYFLHTDMYDIVNMQIDGEMSELITWVDPGQYTNHIVMEKGNKLLYVYLKKALYGTLKAALLFWKNISDNFMNK